MTTAFDVSNDTIVVTSSYVTEQRLPILEVSRKDDEEGGSPWPFHCGDGDYSMERMQLVRLDTILAIDPTVLEVSDLGLNAPSVMQSESPGIPNSRTYLAVQWIIDS